MDWWNSRRGQSASQAAILVAIIGGLLVAYILFLPPSQREQLLFGSGDGSGYGGSGGQSGGGTITQYGPVLILRESPGTLRKLASPTVEHPVPSSTIFTAINTQEVKSIDSAAVKNGVFAKQSLDIEFDVAKGSSRNFLLSFNVGEAAEGALRILVNGHLIYERPVRERSPAPIPLSSDFLVNGVNHVVLETDDPGVAFWKSNAYLLHNILITADVADDSSAVAAQTFSIPDDEYASFESALLQYVPECDQKKASRLIVQLNSRLAQVGPNQTREVPNVLYSGLPDCGVISRVEVSKEQLRSGENHVLFASQGGAYTVSRTKLVIKLNQNDYPIYYFNLPKEMYDTLDAGHGTLRLTLTFTDYRNSKAGEIVVNGFVQSFTTNDYAYQAVIDPGIINPGPNTIKVAPHIDRLDLAEIKIELV